MTETKITWEWGTAYDFFISLRVLHHPSRYGLRPSWAAGVRSRVPVEHREILEQMQAVAFLPWRWIHDLPAPKDSATVLWMLGQIPPEQRLLTLLEASNAPPAATALFREVAARQTWGPEDMESIREVFQPEKPPPRAKGLAALLELLITPAESGERYLAALRAYQQVFFAEEERHLLPKLRTAVEKAKERARQRPLRVVIEDLSRGVRLGADMGFSEWVFVPSYWISPLVYIHSLTTERAIFVFGGRPANESLEPGALVPADMLRTLKTLADPTRLRILRYLSQESVSPAELARRLRLRAPTVTHHLNVLRLAGLVYLTIGEKDERCYTARLEAVDALFEGLKGFLAERPEE